MTAGGHNAQESVVCEHRRMGPSVLIVDDHAGFRAAACALLEADGFRVVGQASDGREAVAAAARLHPQLVLLDVQLPGRSGFKVAEQLAALPEPPVVVLISVRPAASFGGRVEGASAVGFISKSDLWDGRLSELVR
jgi:DNA-binding NarL/FixJ family response regulator